MTPRPTSCVQSRGKNRGKEENQPTGRRPVLKDAPTESGLEENTYRTVGTILALHTHRHPHTHTHHLSTTYTIYTTSVATQVSASDRLGPPVFTASMTQRMACDLRLALNRGCPPFLIRFWFFNSFARTGASTHFHLVHTTSTTPSPVRNPTNDFSPPSFFLSFTVPPSSEKGRGEGKEFLPQESTHFKLIAWFILLA